MGTETYIHGTSFIKHDLFFNNKKQSECWGHINLILQSLTKASGKATYHTPQDFKSWQWNLHGHNYTVSNYCTKRKEIKMKAGKCAQTTFSSAKTNPCTSYNIQIFSRNLFLFLQKAHSTRCALDTHIHIGFNTKMNNTALCHSLKPVYWIALFHLLASGLCISKTCESFPRQINAQQTRFLSIKQETFTMWHC